MANGRNGKVTGPIKLSDDTKVTVFWEELVERNNRFNNFYNEEVKPLGQKFKSLLHQAKSLQEETNQCRDHFNDDKAQFETLSSYSDRVICIKRMGGETRPLVEKAKALRNRLPEIESAVASLRSVLKKLNTDAAEIKEFFGAEAIALPLLKGLTERGKETLSMCDGLYGMTYEGITIAVQQMGVYLEFLKEVNGALHDGALLINEVVDFGRAFTNANNKGGATKQSVPTPPTTTPSTPIKAVLFQPAQQPIVTPTHQNTVECRR